MCNLKMIEQLVFVACLTLYMYLKPGNIWRRSIVCRKKRQGTWKTWMMFYHAVNACTGCYFYNALFLRTRE